jgi:hypothetical protein
MTTGKELYYAQKDNRSAGEVTYRMRLTTRGRDEITAQIQNVSPVRYSVLGILVTAYEPGDVRTAHFLRRRSADVWDYYLVTATRQSPRGTNERSLVNRAAAVYRYVAGQRTDEEPPLAP